MFVEQDGTVIWDSTLIAEYLDETDPQPSFYPSDSRTRLECLKWEELADHLGENIINLWILNLTNNLEVTHYRKKLETSINRFLLIFDQQLAPSQYLLGNDTWTAADVAALCSVGYYSLRLNKDWVSRYHHLRNWFDQLHERELVKSTVPMPLN